MKRLPPFRLHEPSTVSQVVELLGAEGGGARVLAGGTDLLVDMKLGRVRPAAVINLKGIEGLDRIEASEGDLRIGPLVRISTMESSGVLRERCRALWEASRVLATRPVRNLATLGGNLGRASPASDMAPPLIIHGCQIQIEGIRGARLVPVEDFHRGPGLSCLTPDEIVTAVLVPAPMARTGTAYRKLGKRGGGWDIALVGVAAALRLGEAGEVADARIALASVGPTSLRARTAEAALRGVMPTPESLAEAAQLAAAETQPISDLRATASYRKVLARVLTLRTLTEAWALARRKAPAQ